MSKLFFISDVHGCFDAMIEALNKANYDENNPNNKLIVLGDIFDRGNGNLKVYEYLKRLTEENKAIVLLGNHGLFLKKYLDGTSINPFNYLYNGTNTTLDDFLGRTRSFESWCFLDKGIENPTYGDFVDFIKETRHKINKDFPELLTWLNSLPRYFESKNYIGVHGSIDTNVEDWHKPHCQKVGLIDWDCLDFDDGSFFGKEIKNTNKTVIIGHFGTAHLRKKYNINDEKPQHSILTRNDNKIVAIDGTTIISGIVNVYVVEDELL